MQRYANEEAGVYRNEFLVLYLLPVDRSRSLMPKKNSHNLDVTNGSPLFAVEWRKSCDKTSEAYEQHVQKHNVALTIDLDGEQ